MKLLSTCFLSLGLCCSTHALARPVAGVRGPLPSAASGAEAAPARVSADQLLGRWSSSAKAVDGQTLTAEIELRRDQRFRGRASVGDELLMTYAGVWGFEGNKIQWHYLTSSPPTPAQARTDSDEVTSVDSQTLVVRSVRTGVTSTFTKVD